MTDIEKLIAAIENERIPVLTTGKNGTIVVHSSHEYIVDAESVAASLLEKLGIESVTIFDANTWTKADLGNYLKK